jgi:hypothetical protein
MTPKKRIVWLLVMAGVLQLLLILGPPQSAWAVRTDVAMFYDSLASYGNWIDYENYGPVWYPNQVDRTWRPYMNGRWTPTAEGWAFETDEPWGWATYHYGNWMPTTQYGWVWYPGSTWYPSTAAWRTSDTHIGWAPIPPPDYVPEPAFYPETAQYYPEGEQEGGGYYPEPGYAHEPGYAPQPGYAPGIPPLDYLGAPFWIFTEALNFLQGFGQPYAPGYSYYNCGCLSPFGYNPIAYGSTFLLTDFYSPFYAPNGCYAYGPPFPFVSRVTNVNINNFNNVVNNYNFARMRNGLPPQAVLAGHPYFRDSIPNAVWGGQRFQINRAENITQAERRLADPRALAAPKNLPAVSGQIPKVMAAPGRGNLGPAAMARMKGMQLPRQATVATTPQMRQQIQMQRKLEQAAPRIETKPEFRPQLKGEVGPQPPGGIQPIAPKGITSGPKGEIRPTPPQREVRPATPQREIRPTTPLREVRPVTPPREVRPTTPQREIRAVPQKEYRPAPARTYTPAPQQQFRAAPSRGYTPPSIPQEFRAAPRPQFQAAPRPAAPAPRVTAPAAPRPAPTAPAAPRPAAPAPGVPGTQRH